MNEEEFQIIWQEFWEQLLAWMPDVYVSQADYGLIVIAPL